MFKPVPMTRLRAVVLAKDERAVLQELGRLGALQLARLPAGPDTAPLPPRDPRKDLSRCDRLLERLDGLRRSLEVTAPAGAPTPLPAMTLDGADEALRSIEEQAAGLLGRRQGMVKRQGELTAVCERVSSYRGLDIPLDQPDRFSFHNRCAFILVG